MWALGVGAGVWSPSSSYIAFPSVYKNPTYFERERERFVKKNQRINNGLRLEIHKFEKIRQFGGTNLVVD